MKIVKHVLSIALLALFLSKIFAQDTEIIIPGTPENSFLYVINSNGEILFTIRGTGEVEIGTSNPSTAFSVKGTSSQTNGGYFEVISDNAVAVKGFASNALALDTTFGGYFISNGEQGVGCYGVSYGSSGTGILGETTGENGVAISGAALAPGGLGGFFLAVGSEGVGIIGKNTGSEGGKGVQGQSSGDNGIGAYGLATGKYSIGVQGEIIEGIGGIGVKGYVGQSLQPDTTYGGHFTSESPCGGGCYGISTGYDGRGIIGESTGRRGIAVFGNAMRNAGSHPGSIYGGYFIASETNEEIDYMEDDLKPIGIKAVGDYYGGVFKGDGGIKCYGQSPYRNAVWAFNREGTAIKSISVDSSALYGQTVSGIGVNAISDNGISVQAISPQGIGLFVKGKNSVSFHNTRNAAAIVQGNLVVKDYTTGDDIIQMGKFGDSPSYELIVSGNMAIKDPVSGDNVVTLGKGLDIAEGFNTDEYDVQPGTVVVIDTVNPGNLSICKKAYDKKVAGIVSGANGLNSGLVLRSPNHQCNVALMGRVYCNVDATESAVQAGDLLTTSNTPGYAMKVTDFDAAPGAIIGKAMEALDKGKKGKILILVTLQ